MLLELNVIALVVVPDELNMPVVRLNPFNASVPLVNVTVEVAVIVNASPTVVVPVVLLTISEANVVLPLLVIVPVPTIVGVKLVNVPPDESVNPFKFNEVVPGLNAVVPKFNVLNQLPVVNVVTAVPAPTKDTFGALVAEPPVVPNVTVLVTDASTIVKPPVPVHVKPVAVAIDNTVVPAVVASNRMLLEPKAIERVLVLLELKYPVPMLYPFKFNEPVLNVIPEVAAIFKALPKE